jgi:molecular chaperone Hsp33
MTSITPTTSDASYTPAPSADFVLPFELPALGLRGRFIRLDTVSSRALSAHPLPEAAQRVLAEALVLAGLLGSALKFEGRLSVQLKGNGPLDLLVTDYFAGATPGGGLRGYARLNEGDFAALGEPAKFAKLAGSGALAITIEPKKGAQTYQGLVPLSPEGLSASAETYFFQSEQLPTALRLSAGPSYRSGEGRGWRAGAIMVQAVPGREADRDKTSDDWHRIQLFLKTLEDYELLDTAISAESVLWRLFHEDEVRVLPSRALRFECSCRAENIRSVLGAYPAAELKDLPDPDGVIRTRCEFCATVYEFPLASFAA